ncbi:MAG: folate family ECF transporter S component, partial [Hungatella sp.]
MKKLATLFSDSYAELKQVKTITTMAMFAAISVILGYFTI